MKAIRTKECLNIRDNNTRKRTKNEEINVNVEIYEDAKILKVKINKK